MQVMFSLFLFVSLSGGRYIDSVVNTLKFLIM